MSNLIASKQLGDESLQIALDNNESQKFISRDGISMDHSSLTDVLDKDIETLKKFKEKLSASERELISRLMIHLQVPMQREEVATVGGASR